MVNIDAARDFQAEDWIISVQGSTPRVTLRDGGGGLQHIVRKKAGRELKAMPIGIAHRSDLCLIILIFHSDNQDKAKSTLVNFPIA